MARRSKAANDPLAQVQEIKQLLDNFLERIHDSDLRQQVRSLVPAVHSLRDLGSGLILVDGSNAGRTRILAYLRKHPKTLIDGDELLVISGIGEWARRTRELRVEHGWQIYTGNTIRELLVDQPELRISIESDLGVDADLIKRDQYVLMRAEQDREAALRWNQLNTIRKQPGGVKAKLLEFLRLNAGHAVTGEELRYLAGNRKEWARRTRELRTEEGWPVVTRMQGRDDLAVGEYLLEKDKQAEVHDRKIPDDVRVRVLQRDSHRCSFCGWSRDQIHSDDPRKFIEIHHIFDHVLGGANSESNLVTLCNVHHDAVHRGGLEWTGQGWIERATGKSVSVNL